MLAWLKAGNVPADAYFAENDLLAASAIRALQKCGFRVPDDVSVIGFDDVQICEMIDPPITTMHAFKERLGQLAVNQLDYRIRSGDTLQTCRQSGLLKIALSLQLKERRSVRRVE
jgi:LacI family transcriptional regulator